MAKRALRLPWQAVTTCCWTAARLGKVHACFLCSGDHAPDEPGGDDRRDHRLQCERNVKRGMSLVETRPFRAPSPSVTMAGMFGGGAEPKPGEVTLAHHGVLFLDEFPEFKRELIEMFRLVLEEHRITQVRSGKAVTFPADFIFIAAANPCPCGYYPDRRYCHCSLGQIQRYQSRLSGPILDRIDLFVRCDKISYEVMAGKPSGETSADVRERVRRVWEIQKERFLKSGTKFNGRMGTKEVERFCALDGDSRALLREVFDRLRLTGRSYTRILKVGRTIADLAGSSDVREEHLRRLFYSADQRICRGGCGVQYSYAQDLCSYRVRVDRRRRGYDAGDGRKCIFLVLVCEYPGSGQCVQEKASGTVRPSGKSLQR